MSKKRDGENRSKFYEIKFNAFSVHNIMLRFRPHQVLIYFFDFPKQDVLCN